MKKLNEKSIGIAVVLTIAQIIVLVGVLSSDKKDNTENIIYNTSPHMDTIEVIIEYDGDREIRWYTLDTCYGRK